MIREHKKGSCERNPTNWDHGKSTPSIHGLYVYGEFLRIWVVIPPNLHTVNLAFREIDIEVIEYFISVVRSETMMNLQSQEKINEVD